MIVSPGVALCLHVGDPLKTKYMYRKKSLGYFPKLGSPLGKQSRKSFTSLERKSPHRPTLKSSSKAPPGHTLTAYIGRTDDKSKQKNIHNKINTLVVSSKSTALNQRAVTTRYKAVCRWGEASNAARREAGCDVKKTAPMVMNRSGQPGTLNPGLPVTVNIVAEGILLCNICWRGLRFFLMCSVIRRVPIFSTYGETNFVSSVFHALTHLFPQSKSIS